MSFATVLFIYLNTANMSNAMYSILRAIERKWPQSEYRNDWDLGKDILLRKNPNWGIELEVFNGQNLIKLRLNLLFLTEQDHIDYPNVLSYIADFYIQSENPETDKTFNFFHFNDYFNDDRHFTCSPDQITDQLELTFQNFMNQNFPYKIVNF